MISSCSGFGFQVENCLVGVRWRLLVELTLHGATHLTKTDGSATMAGWLHGLNIAEPVPRVMSSKITMLKMTRDMGRSWPAMAVIMEQDNIHHAR
jgi:hypothetical protein